MADQFPHDDLTAYSNRRETYRLSALVAHVLEGESQLASMGAVVKVFAALCEMDDVDPEAAFSQLLDAENSGHLAIDPDERAELLPSLVSTH